MVCIYVHAYIGVYICAVCYMRLSAYVYLYVFVCVSVSACICSNVTLYPMFVCVCVSVSVFVRVPRVLCYYNNHLVRNKSQVV